MRVLVGLVGLCVGSMAVPTTAPDYLPSIPAINLTFPSNPLILSALAYTKEHTTVNTVNHCVRSAYWSLIIAKKDPTYAGKQLDMEAVILAALLHDLGWATTKSLVSNDKRFEVDGANIGRSYITAHWASHGDGHAKGAPWDKHRLQLVWDTIALHTTGTIALYKEGEVALTHLGISADFLGPNYPGGNITVEEYKAVVALFPRTGLEDEFTQIMCGLCRDKPATTFDNIISSFGLVYGLDGHGGGKDVYQKEWEGNLTATMLVAGLEALKQYD